jgi:hypothetical protein
MVRAQHQPAYGDIGEWRSGCRASHCRDGKRADPSGLVIAGGFTRELAESLAHLINLTRLVSDRSQPPPAR